ncbi:MAG: uroporphyrinogen-III synthase [Sphingomicrobium sp.]
MLRPEPGASATLARAKEAGLDAVAIPLFEVAAVAWSAPAASDYDALLLTSANAALHGGPKLATLGGLPTYCVGEATATAARAAGLQVVATGDGDGGALLAQIPRGLKLLHLTGVHHQIIPMADQIAVYASRAIDPPPALDVLNGAVALIHSARAGERLGELVRHRGSITIAAISRAAAQACGDGWRAVEASETPTDGALLALASELCQTIRR